MGPGREAAGAPATLGLAAGGEFDLIRRFFAAGVPAARPDIRVGVGDDCAVVAGDGIALSCDLSVDGIHFRRDWLSDREIGYRAAAAALSDLAAMAARPIGLLVSLGLPQADVPAAATGIMEGVAAAADRVGGAVLGGDVSRTTGPLVIDVTVVGEATRPVLRSGARPGDEIWVTGELGAAALAVREFAAGREPGREARERFAEPVPRTREARWLHERGAVRALIDLSDGLAGDAAHVAAASGVAVVLDGGALPVHPAVLRALQDEEEARRLALAGGEDYELCFAAPAGRVAGLRDAFVGEHGVRVSRVGRVEAGSGVWIEAAGGRARLTLPGFQHFSERP